MVINGKLVQPGQVWRTRRGAEVVVLEVTKPRLLGDAILCSDAVWRNQRGGARHLLATGVHDLVSYVKEWDPTNPGEMPALPASVVVKLVEALAHKSKVVAESKTAEYTGGSVSYYKIQVDKPTSGGGGYAAECNDIIEALEMNYAEGNAFKALWRRAAARMGKAKAGYKDGLYDAEKVVFFGQRLVAQESQTPAVTGEAK